MSEVHDAWEREEWAELRRTAQAEIDAIMKIRQHFVDTYTRQFDENHRGRQWTERRMEWIGEQVNKAMEPLERSLYVMQGLVSTADRILNPVLWPESLMGQALNLYTATGRISSRTGRRPDDLHRAVERALGPYFPLPGDRTNPKTGEPSSETGRNPGSGPGP